jgi:hypothetical protein
VHDRAGEIEPDNAELALREFSQFGYGARLTLDQNAPFPTYGPLGNFSLGSRMQES